MDSRGIESLSAAGRATVRASVHHQYLVHLWLQVQIVEAAETGRTQWLHASSHLWLVDSDMDFAPSNFDLPTLLRLQSATNVSIIAPSPHGDNPTPGWNPFAHHPMPRLKERCGISTPEQSCAVCHHAGVEVKAPVFTAAAWQAVHAHIYAGAPDAVLIGDGFVDLYWCNLVGEMVHGCKLPSRQNRSAHHIPSCLGVACAYSYATPLFHLDDQVIVGTNSWCRAVNYDSAPLYKFASSQGLDDFKMQPSWRPPNTTLQVSRACWSLHDAAASQPALVGFDPTRLAALAQSARRGVKGQRTPRIKANDTDQHGCKHAAREPRHPNRKKKTTWLREPDRGAV